MADGQRFSMIRAFKCVVLRICEALGLFSLARARGNGLHILCYHGFQLRDECQFRPQLFISSATFEQRLQYLAKHGFNVLPLEEAIDRLHSGTLPRNAVAITIDDGFKSTLGIAAPLLNRYQLPATVYVTTYYMDKEVPVFRLAAQYLFWSAARSGRDLSRLAGAIDGISASAREASIDEMTWSFIRHGEALESEVDRQRLLDDLAERLGLDLDAVREQGLLSLMNRTDVAALASTGIDVQLHTHRHKFPSESKDAAFREIAENKSRLEAITGRRADHFCYPSGIFRTSQWPWLEEMGVKSATTCLPGINTPETPVYGLTRFLDSEDIRFVEFRAELAGFSEWLRNLVPGRRRQATSYR